MNAPLGTKDRPWRARVSLISGEATNTITAGQPVCLLNTDPSKVVLPSSSGGAVFASPLFAGISANTVTPGNAVEIVAGGYVARAKFLQRTRTGSGASWASADSVAAGGLCSIDTVNNCMAFSAAGAASLASPACVLLESVSSVSGIASSTSDTSTASFANVKVWVRALM